MSVMTKPDTVDTSARENFSVGGPISLVSICLDQDTLDVLKLFVESNSLIRRRS